MKTLYFAFHIPTTSNFDPSEVIAFHSPADRDRFCEESLSEYTNAQYYASTDLYGVDTNLNFGISADDEFWDYAQDCPYTWWHFEQRKTESETDTFNSYEQLAKATQLHEIANAYDRVAGKEPS